MKTNLPTVYHTVSKKMLTTLAIAIILLVSHSNTSHWAEEQMNLGYDSRFGIDYVFAHTPLYNNEKIVKTMAETHAGWINLAAVSWSKVEPGTPKNNVHNYKWNTLDNTIKIWQKYGFRIAISLRLHNGWFAGEMTHVPDVGFLDFEKLLKDADRLPAPEHMDSYRAWISALVERYDGDGIDDMPGLRFPILHYQVGNEYNNIMFWVGTIEDYEVLLTETRKAARSGCDDVQIISNGIRWNDTFHDDPDASKLDERLKTFLAKIPNKILRDEIQRSIDFTYATVAMADDYEILDAGGNGPNFTGSEGYYTWALQELKKNNHDCKIWDMEARCEPVLLDYAGTLFPEIKVRDGKKLLGILRNKRHQHYKKALKWYRAEQSRVLTKYFVERFGAGFEKVFMGMATDWDKTAGEFMAPNPFIGLADKQGNPWPCIYAMQILVDNLDGFTVSSRIENEKDVRLFRFEFDNKPDVWLVWLSDDGKRGMDDELEERVIRIPEIKDSMHVMEIPLCDATCRQWDIGHAESGIEIEISPTPILIVPY